MEGIVNKNVSGVHREACADSEQVTQAVMGRPVVIERDTGDWLYVQTWDGYHGWIQARWVERRARLPERAVTVASMFTDALCSPRRGARIHTKLVITTSLELVAEENDFAHILLPTGEHAWLPLDDLRVTDPAPTGQEVVLTAERFVGVPYLWGGTTPFGIDCSGFTQLVYMIHGVHLPRDAWMQAGDPRFTSVEKGDLLPGDLVFFAGEEDASIITHVGLASGDGRFIHSSGKGVGVWTNSLDDEPYASTYYGGRRVFGEGDIGDPRYSILDSR